MRYAGRCRTCGVALPAGTNAVYDSTTKLVTCGRCWALEAGATTDTTTPTPARDASTRADPAGAEFSGGTLAAAEVGDGTAGASALREYERREERAKDDIRQHHPRTARIRIALARDPQSTTAWAVGARGEQLLGAILDGIADRGVRVLHDRRIPGTKANIDHLAIAASGVFVIDAKRYQGRPELRVSGGLFRPRTERLVVAGRDCTKLVAGVIKQTGLVAAAVHQHESPSVPITGMLCFVGADWPLIGGSFTIDGVQTLWPKAARKRLLRPGPLTQADISAIHRTLATAFPPA